jgi:hypothetical protein
MCLRRKRSEFSAGIDTARAQENESRSMLLAIFQQVYRPKKIMLDDLAAVALAVDTGEHARIGSGNVSGGLENSMSLAQLSDWCARQFGPHMIRRDPQSRAFNVPWLILDSRLAAREWNWRPETKLHDILEEIALHAEQHPGWLDLSAD